MPWCTLQTFFVQNDTILLEIVTVLNFLCLTYIIFQNSAVQLALELGSATSFTSQDKPVSGLML